jgi:hypothetical protein
MREGTSVATCPMEPGPPPDKGGLCCRHVSRGSRPVSRCRRTLVLPHVLWHRARLPAGEGSGIAMCPAVSDLPPSTGGLWHRHVPHGFQRAMGDKQKGLSGLLTRPGPPASETKASDIRLIMTSPGTWSRQRIQCVQYSHTRCMGSINCVQDINTARRRQYDTVLLDTHNGHATVQGDSTILCSKAAKVSSDPSTWCHTTHGRDVAERHDMAFIRLSTSSLATPS